MAMVFSNRRMAERIGTASSWMSPIASQAQFTSELNLPNFSEAAIRARRWVAALFDSQRRARLRTPFESVRIYYRVQQVFCNGGSLAKSCRTESLNRDEVGAT